LKNIALGTITVILASNIYASDNLYSVLQPDHTYERQALADNGTEIGKGWKFFGDIRSGYLIYDYDNAPLADGTPSHPKRNRGHINSKGIYLIPKLSIQSPYYHGFMAKATLVGATDFGINDEKYESRTFVFDPTEKKSFTLLQEAFIYYNHGNNTALVGREELTTPMIDADDWYMLADTFELARYKNTSLTDTTFHLGYFAKMAGVWDSGANGTEFHSMSDVSFVSTADKERVKDGGVYFTAMVYNDEKHNNLQLWEYYATDLYNTLFLQYDYTNKTLLFNYDAGIQIINFKGVGALANHDDTHIDYTLYQARFDCNFNNGIGIATGVAKYTNGDGESATLGAWGGYPYFANGMIFHYFEAGSLRNAASYKGQLAYSLKGVGIKNTTLSYRLTYFDLDPQHSKNLDGERQSTMKLDGVRLSYADKKGWYFTGTYEHVDLDAEPNTYALRLIGGYKF
jgi:hypothetical protein